MIIFSKKNIAITVLIIYTFFNLKIIGGIIFSKDWADIIWSGHVSANVILGLVIGLFLNAVAILYWLKNNHE